MSSDIPIRLSCRNTYRDSEERNREVPYHDICQNICKLEQIANDIQEVKELLNLPLLGEIECKVRNIAERVLKEEREKALHSEGRSIWLFRFCWYLCPVRKDEGPPIEFTKSGLYKYHAEALDDALNHAKMLPSVTKENTHFSLLHIEALKKRDCTFIELDDLPPFEVRFAEYPSFREGKYRIPKQSEPLKKHYSEQMSTVEAAYSVFHWYKHKHLNNDWEINCSVGAQYLVLNTYGKHEKLEWTK